jgi:carboxyl-terminal processing protease
MESNKKLTFYASTTLVLAVVFFIGAYAGYSRRPWIDRVMAVTNKEPQVVTTADFSPFWKVWNIINQKALDPSIATDQDRVWEATKGLVASLNDPYTVFFPPKDAKSFNEQIKGEFTGVGMEVGIKDKILTVIAPIKNTPAERAGIKSGDKILKIDDTLTTDLPLDKAIEMMRGTEKGSTVRITILHEGDEATKELTIVRDIISIPTIDHKILAGGVHVISLYSFDASSTTLFRNEIQKFKASGDTKLIVDLRGNPGGYLDSAVDMASWFLPTGSVIVKEDYGAKKSQDILKSRGYNIFDSNLKMAILVDGGSASASEIFAGALSEHHIAKLIGAQTFGKGSVQELVPVTDDTYVKITIAKWLTPNNVSISEKGLTPDIAIKPAKGDKLGENDAQLDRAVLYVTSGK